MSDLRVPVLQEVLPVAAQGQDWAVPHGTPVSPVRTSISRRACTIPALRAIKPPSSFPTTPDCVHAAAISAFPDHHSEGSRESSLPLLRNSDGEHVETLRGLRGFAVV